MNICLIKRPSFHLLFYVVSKENFNPEEKPNEETNRKIAGHLFWCFLATISPRLAEKMIPDNVSWLDKLHKRLIKTVTDFYSDEVSLVPTKKLGMLEDLAWDAFIDSLNQQAPKGQMLKRLISYPDGQPINANPVLHLERNSVNVVGSYGDCFDHLPSKIVVRVTTAHLRELVLGYTENNTIFLGATGRETEEQEKEDITIFKETPGPRCGQSVFDTRVALHVDQHLRNNPFTSDEVWEAFFKPESFQMGVYAI